MTLLHRFRRALRVLLTPSCWIMNDPYSAQWDATLRNLLQTHRFTPIDEYTAQLGPHRLWTCGHPYGSFQVYRDYSIVPARASRATVLEAGDDLRLSTCLLA